MRLLPCSDTLCALLDLSVCLKGAKQITASNESDNSFINKQTRTEYTLACFTHNPTSQKSYTKINYTQLHTGQMGSGRGGVNGKCLTHPVSMCPVDQSDDSSSWLLPPLVPKLNPETFVQLYTRVRGERSLPTRPRASPRDEHC